MRVGERQNGAGTLTGMPVSTMISPPLKATDYKDRYRGERSKKFRGLNLLELKSSQKQPLMINMDTPAHAIYHHLVPTVCDGMKLSR